MNKKDRIYAYTRNLVHAGYDAEPVMLAEEMIHLGVISGPLPSAARYVREALDDDVTEVHTTVVGNDFHFPFHDVAGVENFLYLCADLQPDNIVLNGDVLDCFSISRFPAAPGGPDIQAELDAARPFLEDLRELCPLAVIDYTEGNHEERLIRVLKDNPGLFNLRSLRVPAMLGLDDLDIAYHAYMDPVQVQNVSVVHGNVVRKHAGYSAKGTLVDKDFQHVVIGHTHRMGMYCHTGRRGRRIAFENGCMCDPSQADYIKGVPNWQPGFCVIEQRDEEVQIIPVSLAGDGSFVFRGEVYKTESK